MSHPLPHPHPLSSPIPALHHDIMLERLTFAFHHSQLFTHFLPSSFKFPLSLPPSRDPSIQSPAHPSSLFSRRRSSEGGSSTWFIMSRSVKVPSPAVLRLPPGVIQSSPSLSPTVKKSVVQASQDKIRSAIHLSRRHLPEPHVQIAIYRSCTVLL